MISLPPYSDVAVGPRGILAHSDTSLPGGVSRTKRHWRDVRVGALPGPAPRLLGLHTRPECGAPLGPIRIKFPRSGYKGEALQPAI